MPDLATARGATPLLATCEQGQRQTVALLLAHRLLAVNAADDRGKTALMAAAANDHRHIVRQLLRRRDIAPYLTDRAGLNAIDYAVRGGHLAIADLVRKHGALGGVAQLWAISYHLLN